MDYPSWLPSLTIDPPYHLESWIGLALLCLAVVVGIITSWEPLNTISRRRWVILALMASLAPLAPLAISIPLPFNDYSPLWEITAHASPTVIFPLVALPWIFAGGFFSPLGAVVVAAVSGLVVAQTNTHHWFTLLEYMGLALVFSVMVRQRYRTTLFDFWRHPLGSGLTLAVFYAPLYILTSFLASAGPVVSRVDHALTQTWPLMLTRGIELLAASLVAELVYLLGSRDWGRSDHLAPSPLETSLQRRFFLTTVPLVMVLIIALTIGDWVVTGNTARRMVKDQLQDLADIAAESLPPFLETGLNLISSMGSAEFLGMDEAAITSALEARMYQYPFFSQLVVINNQNVILASYPKETASLLRLSEDELTGLKLVSRGAPGYFYLVEPPPGEEVVLLSFISAITDKVGKPAGVILGRTDLLTNPITRSFFNAISNIQEKQGEATILDEYRRVIYRTSGIGLVEEYDGDLPVESGFFEETSTTGSTRMGYYRTLGNESWSVLVQVPAEYAQAQAFEIAVPLLVMIISLSGLIFIVLHLGLRRISESLKVLSNEATLIAQGSLEQSLQVTTADEVGQAGRAFERMRLSLKARLDELNDLLKVSQAVAANLEAGEAVRPILEAALGEGASSARVILPQDVVVDLQSDRPAGLGAGPLSESYAYLDAQIFELMRSQDLMSIPNTSRIRRLNFTPGGAQPGAVVALALHRESRYFGAFWVAYDHPHKFSEEEVRFLGTLANQAALAASNARLYTSAEIGRQRLEAVLVSSPEPVLVIDEKLRLLLLNSAAMQVPGLIMNSTPGESIQKVISHPQLLELITRSREEKITSIEISLPNHRVFSASVSLVMANNRLVGKVCIMQDITHYKNLDTLKSDFVETVSHDLRSPLTLMRGYTTMLQMVGDLNEQQKNYSAKIISGVDSMTHLINNLLDLGRIDAGISLRIERITAQDIIEQVLTDLQPQAAQKNIHLSPEYTSILPVQIEADRALLQQALYNLVENGIKFSPLGGSVKVHLISRAETVVFEVHDNGIGIAPLDLPRIYEKFYRSSRRETYPQRGTGLGLAIVKSITERHKGKVGVESQLGRGSIFSIEVPYHQPTNE